MLGGENWAPEGTRKGVRYFGKGGGCGGIVYILLGGGELG